MVSDRVSLPRVWRLVAPKTMASLTSPPPPHSLSTPIYHHENAPPPSSSPLPPFYPSCFPNLFSPDSCELAGIVVPSLSSLSFPFPSLPSFISLYLSPLHLLEHLVALICCFLSLPYRIIKRGKQTTWKELCEWKEEEEEKEESGGCNVRRPPTCLSLGLFILRSVKIFEILRVAWNAPYERMDR